MKIGFLGTGLMGAHMVRRLAQAGHDLTIWNRTEERAQALSDVARVARHPSDVTKGAKVIIAMLLDGPITRSTLVDDGVMDALDSGTTIIDMGSVDPKTDQDLAKLAKDRDCNLLDAPVSGGVVGAQDGSMSIFVGGNMAVFEAVSPVLNALGRPTHLGPVGAGQITKLANQLIVASTIGAVAEGLRLAEAGGCDPAQVRLALAGGFADSRILELHGKRMVEGDFVAGGRSVAQLKDLNNAMSEADRFGLELPLGACIRDGFRDLVERRDGGDLDHSAYYLWLKQRLDQI
ncbi:MAG: NAD(P)-dependent oxidoreductase [Hyphomicrobiales bacterium]|jgi:2-hydroxy-3-oxopropionate reductase